MNPEPTCMTCEHWLQRNPSDGWCMRFAKFTYDTETCKKYVPVKIEPIDKLKNPPQLVDKEEWFC